MTGFTDLVYHKHDWDIKEEKSWVQTIGTPFPGFGTPIYYDGTITTVEELGNYTYGYLGCAFGFSLPTLYAGSYVAAGFPTGGPKLENELLDWKSIKSGFAAYG